MLYSRASSALLETSLRKKLGVDEQVLRSVWRAFGSYIAKQLVNGKGVVVPRFGVFTFTAAEVNLAVSSID